MQLRSNLQKFALISLPLLGIVYSPNLARGNYYQIDLSDVIYELDNLF